MPWAASDRRVRAQEFVAKSVARWAAASDETQDVGIALDRSKQLIASFGTAVSSGACVPSSANVCQ